MAVHDAYTNRYVQVLRDQRDNKIARLYSRLSAILFLFSTPCSSIPLQNLWGCKNIRDLIIILEDPGGVHPAWIVFSLLTFYHETCHVIAFEGLFNSIQKYKGKKSVKYIGDRQTILKNMKRKITKRVGSPSPLDEDRLSQLHDLQNLSVEELRNRREHLVNCVAKFSSLSETMLYKMPLCQLLLCAELHGYNGFISPIQGEIRYMAESLASVPYMSGLSVDTGFQPSGVTEQQPSADPKNLSVKVINLLLHNFSHSMRKPPCFYTAENDYNWIEQHLRRLSCDDVKDNDEDEDDEEENYSSNLDRALRNCDISTNSQLDMLLVFVHVVVVSSICPSNQIPLKLLQKLNAPKVHKFIHVIVHKDAQICVHKHGSSSQVRGNSSHVRGRNVPDTQHCTDRAYCTLWKCECDQPLPSLSAFMEEYQKLFDVDLDEGNFLHRYQQKIKTLCNYVSLDRTLEFTD